MRNATDNFINALGRLIDEDGMAIAMSVITGSFVSIVTQYMEHKGYSTDCDIKIDGCEKRDITIHAPKETK